jgi:hypothetical protein
MLTLPSVPPEIVQILAGGVLAGAFSIVGIFVGIWLSDRDLKRRLLRRLNLELSLNSGRVARIATWPLGQPLEARDFVPELRVEAMLEAAASRSLLNIEDAFYYQLLIAIDVGETVNAHLKSVRDLYAARQIMAAMQPQAWARAHAVTYHEFDARIRTAAANLAATRSQRKKMGDHEFAETVVFRGLSTSKK